jgi:hypothetical protein
VTPRICTPGFWRAMSDERLAAWIVTIDDYLLPAQYDELLKHEAANVGRVAYVQADIRITRRAQEIARNERQRRCS